MRQFLHVLRFEMGNYFKNKMFLIITFLFMILAAGAVIVPGILMSISSSSSEDHNEVETPDSQSPVALYDPDGKIRDLSSLEAALGGGFRVESCDSADEVRSRVESHAADAGFLVEDLLHFTYVVENNSMTDMMEEYFTQAMASLYRAEVLADQGIDAVEMENLYQTLPTSETEILGKDSVRNYAYTYLLIMVLYFMLIFYGQMIAVAVTTEKSNRAIEILVTSVSSNSLIFGKVLAGAISGVIQCTLILGAAVGSYQFFRESWNYQLDFLFQIPLSVWLTFIIFGLMGYLLYAFLYGMLGALVSKTEDISKTSTPIMILYIASFMIAIFGMNASDSLLMKLASFFPFTSSNAMLVRVAMGSIQPWEIMISGIILAVSCGVVGILAAKIFRFATLLYGNPIKFSKALKGIREK